MKRLGAALLLTLVVTCWAREKGCPTSASDCNQCIQADPKCSWCSTPGVKARCNTEKRHLRAKCTDLYNPTGELSILRNVPRRDSTHGDGSEVLLEPQMVSLRLRPGLVQSFLLAVTTDRPTSDMDISGAPDGLNITFAGKNKDAHVVNVQVPADHCGSQGGAGNSTGPWSVRLTPRGLPQSLEMTVQVECECDCMRSHCQVSMDDAMCRSSPGAPVCSGSGECEDGGCVCRARENPTERYSGRFCECDNFNCDYSSNKICGGQGSCECRTCVCNEGWVGSACDCRTDVDACMASNGLICNGRGVCDCGVCRCNPPFQGPTCEVCPTCVGRS